MHTNMTNMQKYAPTLLMGHCALLLQIGVGLTWMAATPQAHRRQWHLLWLR